MSTVIVTGAAGLIGSENVKWSAREGFRVANRRKLIKPV
jgi:nucleoside-diphosphate-sugar epimerase